MRRAPSADTRAASFTCLEGSNRGASGDTRSLGLRPPGWTLSASDLLFPPEPLPQHAARARQARVRLPERSVGSQTLTCLRITGASAPGPIPLCRAPFGWPAGGRGHQDLNMSWILCAVQVAPGRPCGKCRVAGWRVQVRGALHPPCGHRCDQRLGKAPHLRSASLKANGTEKMLDGTSPFQVLSLTATLLVSYARTRDRRTSRTAAHFIPVGRQHRSERALENHPSRAPASFLSGVSGRLRQSEER